MSMRKMIQYLWHHGTSPQDVGVHLPWWRQPFFGYPVGLFLVIVMVLANFLVKQMHFLWTPFCLVTVIVGFVWGVSPALVTMVLGFLAFNFFIVPQYGLLTAGAWNDVRVFGPFVLVQFAIALLAAHNAVQQRRILVAKQEIGTYVQELAAANQQLERANHLKDYFMTRAAHELRTPVTTILGESQLALRRLNKIKEAATEMLVWRNHFEKIEERTRHLNVFIEELIDISSFRSEGMQLRIGTCNFERLCQEAIEHLCSCSECSIGWTLPSVPIILQADCERLSHVVLNIVNNALQYSAENTVVNVCIYATPSAAILQVHNEGPALSDEEQEHLFDPFYRSPYAETRFREGWGLGLTISKEIVERHGGHIWVESSEGNGITFFVQIPLQSK
jgi:signal transduction histidine kinase